MVRRRLVPTLVLVLVLVGVIPAAAQAALRVPKVMGAVVVNPYYCQKWGINPRVEIEMNTPAKVTFWTYQVAVNGKRLPTPVQSAGPKTSSLVQGRNSLTFEQAFGIKPSMYAKGAIQTFVALPASGVLVGVPYTYTQGFGNLALCL